MARIRHLNIVLKHLKIGRKAGVVLRRIYAKFDLSNADLRDADLHECVLVGANLRGANLVAANLVGANLSGANLSGANLSGANLRGAKLVGANLHEANLRGANLSGVELHDVVLSRQQIFDIEFREELSKRSSGSISTTVPHEQNSESKQELTLHIDPGNASARTIQAVMEALSDVHRAAGGIGLEFRTDGLELHVFEEAH